MYDYCTEYPRPLPEEGLSRRRAPYPEDSSDSLLRSVVRRAHIFSIVGMSTRSEGEWACSIVGPNEIMSSPGIFSANTAHSRPAWMTLSLIHI